MPTVRLLVPIGLQFWTRRTKSRRNGRVQARAIFPDVLAIRAAPVRYRNSILTTARHTLPADVKSLDKSCAPIMRAMRSRDTRPDREVEDSATSVILPNLSGHPGEPTAWRQDLKPRATLSA